MTLLTLELNMATNTPAGLATAFTDAGVKLTAERKAKNDALVAANATIVQLQAQLAAAATTVPATVSTAADALLAVINT